MVFVFSLVVAALSIAGVFALVCLEAYIRWTINKDFTFLGESGLGALILASFGLLAALLFAHRTPKN